LKPFDADGAFAPVGEGGELRQLAIQGAGVSVFSQGTVFAVQMVATVVLARLLTPADFGVVTMVTTFSLLLISFGLNGFTEGVLQREQIDHSLVSNLFWISVSVGLLLTAGFALSGSLLARFYGNPHVEHVAVGMSVTIFLGSASVLHLALLKRAMRFSAVSANSVVAQAFSVAVSILLGLAGWGYWALVAGNLTLHLSTCIGAWSLCRWVPGFPRRAAGTAEMARFAMNVYSHFLVNYAAGNMDNLLVGWRFGAPSLGFYKKAFDLFVLPASQLLSPVAPVAISTLSRVNRDLVQYRRYFLSGLSILAFLGMGVGADLTLVGKDLIRMMLGTQWGASGRIFAFFGPGIGVMLVYGTHAWIHLSIGRPQRWFRWGVIELAVTGLLFVLALPWGPVGIAAAWTASFWILTIPAFWYAGRPIDFGVAPVLGAVWKYLFASLLAACASAEIIRGIPSLLSASGFVGAASRVVIISLCFGALYLGGIILLHGGFAPLNQVASLLPLVVPFVSRFSRWSSPVAAMGDTAPAKPLAPVKGE
jgi:PST family polysaccharide transporter